MPGSPNALGAPPNRFDLGTNIGSCVGLGFTMLGLVVRPFPPMGISPEDAGIGFGVLPTMVVMP